MATNKTLRTCKNGHKFYKSSDCPTCPICEKDRISADHPFSFLAAPARRALENNNIFSLHDLSKYTEEQILTFHGMGPGSLPKLRVALGSYGLKFKK